MFLCFCSLPSTSTAREEAITRAACSTRWVPFDGVKEQCAACRVLYEFCPKNLALRHIFSELSLRCAQKRVQVFTARTGVMKLSGRFLQLPVENRHVVYTVQAELPVLRIAKEIHKQSFHYSIEGKRRHRAPEQLRQSAFMLWF